ncbi:MAG: Alpha/Beta hydrolase protein [Piptocephalis tieghemiana]|nr:MAG: Alpha/Beta hydrolase protein [Piptocephalis tieghemiana]KAI9226145.1 MAG: Alpha/Beta hydrolase protein [Piptocephalis tieghemiana]
MSIYLLSLLKHSRKEILGGWPHLVVQHTTPTITPTITDQKSPPLFLFIHGLGAQVDQFSEQFAHLQHHAHILALDALGHGGSGDSRNYADYTADALVDRWILLVSRHADPRVPWIVCGHSYGSILALRLCKALVASPNLPSPSGLILLAPPASDTTGSKGGGKKGSKWLLSLPDPCLEVLRWMDRWGGLESHSVRRLLGPGASVPLKTRQLGWNKASRTRTLKRIVAGMPPWEAEEVSLGKGQEGRGKQGQEIPILILAGAEDKVTPPWMAHVMAKSLKDQDYGPVIGPIEMPGSGHQVMLESPTEVNLAIDSFIKQYV